MRNKSLLLGALVVAMTGFLLASAPDARGALPNPAPFNLSADLDTHAVAVLKEEIRHNLVMLPYYNVFDWLQAEVGPGGTVTLMGKVTRPTTKDDAVARVKRLEGVTRVVDNIEVLPLSTMDDQLRI